MMVVIMMKMMMSKNLLSYLKSIRKINYFMFELRHCLSYNSSITSTTPTTSTTLTETATKTRQFLLLNKKIKNFYKINSKRISDNPHVKKCWNCNQTLNDVKSIIFCQSCNSLQPLNENYNYFDLFEIPISYDVDLMKLSQKFKNLQMKIHPDHFSEKSQEEQQLSLDCSSIINKSFNTLRDAYHRGLYLLNIKYHQTIDESDMDFGTEFLETIMQLNETVESKKLTKREIEILEKENKLLIENIISQISNAFKSDNYLEAKQLLTKMKFYITYGEKIKERNLEFL